MRTLDVAEDEADLLFAVLHHVAVTGGAAASASAQSLLAKLNAACVDEPAGATPPPEPAEKWHCPSCHLQYREPTSNRACALCKRPLQGGPLPAPPAKIAGFYRKCNDCSFRHAVDAMPVACHGCGSPNMTNMALGEGETVAPSDA